MMPLSSDTVPSQPDHSVSDWLFSTKIQTKYLNYFALWSSGTVEDERDGNGRWRERKWEPGCSSVTLIYTCTWYPSGLLIPQQCWILSTPQLNFMEGSYEHDSFFFTETTPKCTTCLEGTPMSWFRPSWQLSLTQLLTQLPPPPHRGMERKIGSKM